MKRVKLGRRGRRGGIDDLCLTCSDEIGNNDETGPDASPDADLLPLVIICVGSSSAY